MEYRHPVSKMERDLLKRFQMACQHLYQQDWHPQLSVRLWEAAFVRGHAIDLLMLSAQTGCWAEWSLRHGMPMLVSYKAWLRKLKHPNKAEVIRRTMT